MFFQYCYSFFCFFMMMTVWGMYKKMDGKASQLDKKSKVQAADDTFKK